ncbi:leucine-rich repeat and coiled-coil domain-containing protein 1-like [Diprion similis]|uniref:leucine-rich repeat and coiled-coil domain-containing protein 1-like n=1 Tax=Diprion similis TaxID=362088 RepID=UPI001EF7EF1D|nr:leucine-rich repeat and coiled-coil domain-containing protein 1-like [Diprion similis]
MTHSIRSTKRPRCEEYNRNASPRQNEGVQHPHLLFAAIHELSITLQSFNFYPKTNKTIHVQIEAIEPRFNDLSDIEKELSKRLGDAGKDDPDKILESLRDISEEVDKANVVISKEAETSLIELSKMTEDSGTQDEGDVAQKLVEIAEAKRRIDQEREEALDAIKVDLHVEDDELERVMNNSSDDSLEEVCNDGELEMPFTKSEAVEKLRRLRDVEKPEESKTGEMKKEEFVAEKIARGNAICIDLNSVRSDGSDSEESIYEDLMRKPPENFIKGKTYDYDEKKHGTRMTEEFILKHCKENNLYQTPYLNDVLYLHYKGFSFIESLERYTGLKCLWLESNGIREIANLDNQSELRCLFLHHNLISKIENLECLPKLDTLNLAHNSIRMIENLDSLKNLKTLHLSHNYLRETADFEHLKDLNHVTILDLSHNRIESFDVVEVLGAMKSLRVVTLTGNPVIKSIKMYRKTMTLKCKKLTYLDDRPVFPRDRACAEAWMRGGPEEEIAERNRWIQAEQKKINDSVTALLNRKKHFEAVAAAEKEEKEQSENVEAAKSCTDCRVSSELLEVENRVKSVSSTSSSSPSSSPSSSSDNENEYEKDTCVNDFSEVNESQRSGSQALLENSERKASDEQIKELLLPWKAEIRAPGKSPRLIEDMTEIKEHVAGDLERKRLARRVLDNRTHRVDQARSPGPDCVVGTDLGKEILQTIQGGNSIASSSEPAKKDSVLVEDMRNVTTEDDESSEEPLSTSENHISSQLSSVREEMKDFCEDMRKFTEENGIVYKNGEVVRCWGGENKLIEVTDDSKSREETGRWWNTKERKQRVRKILKQREEESLTSAMGSLAVRGPEDPAPNYCQVKQVGGGKRAHEIEGPEVSRKKLLIVEAGGGDPEVPRGANESLESVAERCRRHVVSETRRQTAKPSPLLDSCISTLIRETGEKLSLEGREDFRDELDGLKSAASILETNECLTPLETRETNVESADQRISSRYSGDGDCVTSLSEEAEFPDMDAALRARITRNVNAPKTPEQRERARKSANALMDTSREAMARGKMPAQDFHAYDYAEDAAAASIQTTRQFRGFTEEDHRETEAAMSEQDRLLGCERKFEMLGTDDDEEDVSRVEASPLIEELKPRLRDEDEDFGDGVQQRSSGQKDGDEAEDKEKDKAKIVQQNEVEDCSHVIARKVTKTLEMLVALQESSE